VNAQAIVQLMRVLVQLGISVEQYRAAVNNPDMSDEELAEHINANTDKLLELRDRDHS